MFNSITGYLDVAFCSYWLLFAIVEKILIMVKSFLTLNKYLDYVQLILNTVF